MQGTSSNSDGWGTPSRLCPSGTPGEASIMQYHVPLALVNVPKVTKRVFVRMFFCWLVNIDPFPYSSECIWYNAWCKHGANMGSDWYSCIPRIIVVLHYRTSRYHGKSVNQMVRWLIGKLWISPCDPCEADQIYCASPVLRLSMMVLGCYRASPVPWWAMPVQLRIQAGSDAISLQRLFSNHSH